MARDKIFQKCDMLALAVECTDGRKCNRCSYMCGKYTHNFGRHYFSMHKTEYLAHMDAKKLTQLEQAKSDARFEAARSKGEYKNKTTVEMSSMSEEPPTFMMPKYNEAREWTLYAYCNKKARIDGQMAADMLKSVIKFGVTARPIGRIYNLRAEMRRFGYVSSEHEAISIHVFTIADAQRLGLPTPAAAALCFERALDYSRPHLPSLFKMASIGGECDTKRVQIC